MALASSNFAQLSYIPETDFGFTPLVGNPTNLRMTGESLDFGIQTEASKEIRADRQVTDLVQIGASVSGGFNFELSFLEYDELLEAVCMDTWAFFGAAPVPVSATFAANSLTAGGPTVTDSLFTLLEPGQWVRISGSSIPAQDIVAQVSNTVAPTADVLTFEGTPFAAALGDGGVAVVVNSARLSNGVTQRSFTVERSLTDVGQFYAYTGMNANKLSLNFASGAIVTGSLDFMGSMMWRADATQLPGTPVASQTGDVMNAVSGVGNISEGGFALTGTFIKSLKLDLDNKMRGQTGIGTLGNVGIAAGTLMVTGSMEVYLADGTMYDMFLSNTATSISWTMQDKVGQGYALSLPKVKFSSAKVNAGSLDQDCMLSLPFTALMDEITGRTIFLDRM